MIANFSSAVVYGSNSDAGDGGAGWVLAILLGLVALFLVGVIIRTSTSRPTALWGPMPGSSSDNGSDLGFLVFVSLVVAILLVIGLRGAT